MNGLKNGHRVIYDFLVNSRSGSQDSSRFPMLKGCYLIHANKKDYHFSRVQDEDQTFQELKNHTALKKYIEKQEEKDTLTLPTKNKNNKNNPEDLQGQSQQKGNEPSRRKKRKNVRLKLKYEERSDPNEANQTTTLKNNPQQQISMRSKSSESVELKAKQPVVDNSQLSQPSHTQQALFVESNQAKRFKEIEEIIFQQRKNKQENEHAIQQFREERALKKGISSIEKGAAIKAVNKQFHIRKASRLHSCQDLSLCEKQSKKVGNEPLITTAFLRIKRKPEISLNRNSHHFLFEDHHKVKIEDIWACKDQKKQRQSILSHQSILKEAQAKRKKLHSFFGRKTIAESKY